METLKEETSGFVACKSSGKHGPEGFQRATGKPFGRARRRETLCARKKDEAKYLVNNLKGHAPAIRGTAFHATFLVTE